MEKPITGTTRLYFIVADPVHHVRTPAAFNARLAAAEADAVMVATQVAPAGLADFIAGLRRIKNVGGLIVTVPHKQAMVALCDELAPAAERAGSLNAVRIENNRLIGENFDGIGFVQGLLSAGYDVLGKRALLLGSGGAASAIAFALADAGVADLAIWNRSIDKAEALAERVRTSTGVTSRADPHRDTSGIDLIVNATSLGMRAEDELPIPADAIRSNHMVAEAVMNPPETELLQIAKSHGASVHQGYHMLAAQLDAMGRYVGAF
ncbi:shikimate dehydrogenase family protein [Mesorhizobium sp. NZP2298]|uniref:shikimate dehydrogenase family protein n=1 Tax=Mesorhizobium sp. NZP2298 TaxID=2483403 RepID=UPI0015541FEA|nr:shikimate dehydrogenase [Mesorhizobium sp. NZP2298]QKC98352.1 shikimate dehydrogenase [Mesorhizobium sp. NZP2298]